MNHTVTVQMADHPFGPDPDTCQYDPPPSDILAHDGTPLQAFTNFAMTVI